LENGFQDRETKGRCFLIIFCFLQVLLLKC